MARQNFIGYVVSQGHMNKTIKVRVLQRIYNAKVQKEYMKRKDYLVHDEENICREGDLVRIEATRPLSARKFFAVAEIKINAGQQFATYKEEATKLAKQEEAKREKDFATLRQLNSDNLNKKTDLFKDLEALRSLKYKNTLEESDKQSLDNIRTRYRLNNFTWMGEQAENNADKLLLGQENKVKIEPEEDVSEEVKERRLRDEVIKTDIQLLTEKLASVELNIKLNDIINDLLTSEANKEKLAKIFEIASIEESTPKNIKKNKIKKFLKNATVKELSDLSIDLI